MPESQIGKSTLHLTGRTERCTQCDHHWKALFHLHLIGGLRGAHTVWLWLKGWEREGTGWQMHPRAFKELQQTAAEACRPQQRLCCPCLVVHFVTCFFLGVLATWQPLLRLNGCTLSWVHGYLRNHEKVCGVGTGSVCKSQHFLLFLPRMKTPIVHRKNPDWSQQHWGQGMWDWVSVAVTCHP